MDRKTDSERFDGVADLYDAFRPSYPAELIEAIVQYSDIQQDERILEIGSGTGKATLLFAERGYNILCLDPGQNLIAVAREKLNAYPQVSFVRARFEDWEPEQEKFDLVISAQAYHWVPEEVRFEKTANVLKQGGHLALFWNMYPRLQGEIRQELDQVYDKIAPELVKPERPFDQLIESRANALGESPYFEKVVVKKHSWSARYETKAYLGLLNTYSDHLRLSERRRNLLFAEVAEVVERNGGTIEKPYLAVVYMAQRASV